MSADFDPLEGLPEHLLPKEEWYEQYIRWGLYVGAAFQLVCILAVIFLPPQDKDQNGESAYWSQEEGADDESHQQRGQPGRSAGGGQPPQGVWRATTRRKVDKKKKRQ